MSRRLFFALALGLAASLTFAERSSAGLVLVVGDSRASVGESGTFDLTLKNTNDADAIKISGYSIRLKIGSGLGVEFTGVAEASNYIFKGIAGGLAILDDTATGFRALDDAWDAPFYFSLAAGESIGLLSVSYTIGKDAQSGSVVPITVVTERDDDTRFTGDNPLAVEYIPFSIEGGAITINGDPQVIPEPASIIALATAAALLPLPSLVRRTRRKAG